VIETLLSAWQISCNAIGIGLVEIWGLSLGTKPNIPETEKPYVGTKNSTCRTTPRFKRMFIIITFVAD